MKQYVDLKRKELFALQDEINRKLRQGARIFFGFGLICLLLFTGLRLVNPSKLAMVNWIAQSGLVNSSMDKKDSLYVKFAGDNCLIAQLDSSDDSAFPVKISFNHQVLTRKIQAGDSIAIPLNPSADDSPDFMNIEATINGQFYSQTIKNPTAGKYTITLTGCEPPQKGWTVYYYPGKLDNFGILLKNLKGDGIHVVTKNNPQVGYDRANELYFARNGNRQQQYSLTMTIMEMKVRIKRVVFTDNLSQNLSDGDSAVAEIRGDDNLKNSPDLTLDSLQCIFLSINCGSETAGHINYFVDNRFSYKRTLDVRQCLKNRFNYGATFTIDQADTPRYEILYQDTVSAISLKMIQQCLAVQFPGINFKARRSPMQLDVNVAAEIYILDAATNTRVNLTVDTTSLLKKAEELKAALVAKKYNVNPVKLLRKENGTSSISYYNPVAYNLADDIRSSFEDVFPGLSVNIRDLSKEQFKNSIDVNISGEAVPEKKISIQDITFPDIIKSGSSFKIAFNIVVPEGIIALVDDKFTSNFTICLNQSQNCSQFEGQFFIRSNPVTATVATKGLRAGFYEISIKFPNLGIDTTVSGINVQEQPKTVLWIDDHPENSENEALTRELKAEGYSVILARSNNSALDSLSSNDISLIISDIGRDAGGPDTDGPDAGIRFLEKMEGEYKNIPIIYFTSQNQAARFGQIAQLMNVKIENSLDNLRNIVFNGLKQGFPQTTLPKLGYLGNLAIGKNGQVDNMPKDMISSLSEKIKDGTWEIVFQADYSDNGELSSLRNAVKNIMKLTNVSNGTKSGERIISAFTRLSGKGFASDFSYDYSSGDNLRMNIWAIRKK